MGLSTIERRLEIFLRSLADQDGGPSLTADKASFLAGTAPGALIATLSKPFGPATTYTLVGTVPPQLALASGGRIVAGITASSDGADYEVKVRAVSADDRREVAEMLRFSARPRPLPIVFLSGAQSKLEGDGGTTIFTFTATRAATAGSASIPWTLTLGTASSADLAPGQAMTGTVDLADGQASGAFTVAIAGDTAFEPDETFTVSITPPAGYAAGPSTSATGTILNDDAASVYADPDLNAALAFKQKVKSYDQGTGNRAAQLFAAFPDLKAYLGVGVKTQSLAAGSTAPGWNAATETIGISTGSPTLTGFDVQGMVLVGSGVAADVLVSDCLIRAQADGDFTPYKVQKDNGDANYRVTLRDCTLEGGQAQDVGCFDVVRVYQRYSAADNFKGGSTGGPDRPQRIVRSWGEACGYGNPAAHGDGIQWSTVGDSRVVATVLYSASSDTVYSTNSYGLTNAIRIDASGAPKLVERVHVLGLLSAHGGLYPITVAAQQTDSVVRNVTLAHCLFAPAAFRITGNAGDAIQMHPSFTKGYEGGGLIENVAFYGNEVFGFGPVVYADRGGGAQDITGIWHWNPATLDAGTRSLWIDLGLLLTDGTPAPGMLRSVAGAIAAQPRNAATTGAVPLALDLSGVPDDAVITLHLPAGATMHPLEYVK